MNFSDAVAAMRAGKKVKLAGWRDDMMFPSFIVLIPGREVTASYKPMIDHVGDGARFHVDDHIDAIYNADTNHVSCVVGRQFTQEEIMSDDWIVID